MALSLESREGPWPQSTHLTREDSWPSRCHYVHMVGYLGPVPALLLISLLSLILPFNNLIKKTRLQWNKMLAKYFSYLGKQWVASAVGFTLFMVIIYCQLLIQGCPKTGLCLVLFLLFCLGADGLFQSSGKERSRSFCDSSSSKPQRGTCFAPDPASAPGFRCPHSPWLQPSNTSSAQPFSTDPAFTLP